MNMNTNTLDCHPDAPKRIARVRAGKIRHQCTECLRFGPWTKGKGVHPGPHPAIPVQVNLPGDQPTMAQIDYSALTVADLKEHCKARGITGYSKMKRDDLIAALS